MGRGSGAAGASFLVKVWMGDVAMKFLWRHPNKKCENWGYPHDLGNLWKPPISEKNEASPQLRNPGLWQRQLGKQLLGRRARLLDLGPKIWDPNNPNNPLIS